MVQPILDFFEKRAYGVCEWWGGKLGMRSVKIRLFFIYLSFITFGSPLIIYLIMAFLLEHKQTILFWRKRKTVWDL